MSEHTPGPWKAKFSGDASWSILDVDRWIIADVLGGNQSTDAANARLIASAPELLEALQEVYKAMIDYQMDVEYEAPHKHRQMMNRARAAIAKATGGDGE